MSLHEQARSELTGTMLAEDGVRRRQRTV